MKKLFLAIFCCTGLLLQSSAALAFDDAVALGSEELLVKSFFGTNLSIDQCACSVSDAVFAATLALAGLCGDGYSVENVVCNPCTVVENSACPTEKGVDCSCTGTCVSIPPPTT